MAGSLCGCRTFTVINTDGTSVTVSEPVTINPTITGFSETSITQGKKLTTKIAGLGLNSSAVVTTSNPGITVVSVKASKITKKKTTQSLTVKLTASATAAPGPFNVTVTEAGGHATANSAITVVAKK
jgi:uncharacterized membrane protein